jgi:hypothetical protein
MKTIFKRLFVISICVLFLFSCTNDSITETPCTPIICLNGGTSNASCGCDCPQGFSGTNCSTQLLPTTIKITKIKVKYFPNTDGSNFWDISLPSAVNASPDIYVTLQNSNNVELFNSPTYFSNVISNGTNTWDFIPSAPISISFIYFNSLKIRLYDFDGAVSNVNDGVDDLMTSSIFNIYNSTGGFPATLNLLDPNTPIGYELTLQYVW